MLALSYLPALVILICILACSVVVRRRGRQPSILPNPDPITRREPFDASKRQAR